MNVSVQLLGQPRVLRDTVWLEPPLTKPLCLLAYLAYLGSWVSRDQLAFLFWPDTDETSARRNLRQLLGRAKTMGIVDKLEIETTRVRWSVAVDVHLFQKAIAQQDWATAVSLYGGPLLAGLETEADGFQAWLDIERETLHDMWREAVCYHAARLESEARFTEALTMLKPVLYSDQLAEDVLQQFMRCAYLAGQRELALSSYERFARQLKDELDLEPLEGTLELLETLRSEAKQVSHLPATTREPSKVPLSVLRPPRLVGREAELARIRDAATPVVMVSGEAGAGKSHLLKEAAPTALILKCQEGLRDVPYYPLIQLIREYLRQKAILPPLGQYEDDLVRLVPEVNPSLQPPPAEPDSGRGRLLEALARLLEGLADSQASFQLIADDLQWADDATLSFLRFLAGRNRPRYLAAYRQYEQSAGLRDWLQSLRTGHQLTEVQLTPLSQGAVSELLVDLMANYQGSAIFTDWLYQKTAGNPMFVLETLKSLFESGALDSSTEGGYKYIHKYIDNITDYSELDTPPAITELILRRIARLSDESRRILHIAAVMQEGFHPALLSQIAGLSDWAVLDALEAAEQVGIIQADGFSHDLLRQSIYQSIPELRRKVLHGKVADVLAPSADPLIIAEHHLAAGNLSKAVQSWLKAIISLRTKGLFDAALVLLERTSSYHLTPEQRLRLDIAKAVTLQMHGHNTEGLVLIEDLLTQVKISTDRLNLLSMQATIWLKDGQVLKAERALKQAWDTLPQVTDPDIRMSFFMAQSILLHAQSRFADAAMHLENLLKDVRQQPVSDNLVTVMTSLAATYDMMNLPDKALPLHQEAYGIAKLYGYRYFQIDAALNMLYSLMDLGRTAEGLDVAEEALSLGQYENTATLRTNLATAYLELGDYPKAQQHYQTVIHETEHRQLRALAYARLAEAYHHQGLGNVPEALEQAYRAAGDAAGDIFKARVLISTFKLGSPEQIARVKPWFDELATDSLPGYIQDELRHILSIKSR